LSWIGSAADTVGNSANKNSAHRASVLSIEGSDSTTTIAYAIAQLGGMRDFLRTMHNAWTGPIGRGRDDKSSDVLSRGLTQRSVFSGGSPLLGSQC